MKMFLTYFIAVLFLGLCLIEKESRKKALALQMNNSAMTRMNPKEPAKFGDKNISVRSFDYGNKLSRKGFGQDYVPQFVSGDSLYFEASTQEDNIF